MDITAQIGILKKQIAELLLKLDTLSNEALGFIPEGSNNNILWNLGHILVVPQYYFYVAKGHTAHVEQYLIDNYMSGTRPTTTDIEKEYQSIKQSLLPSLDLLKSDFGTGIFNDFTAFGNLDFVGTISFLTKHEVGHINKIHNILNKK